MSIIYIISSILGVVFTALLGYLEITKKKKHIKLCIFLILVFAIISFCSQQLKEHSDELDAEKKDSFYNSKIDSLNRIQVAIKDSTNRLLRVQNKLLRSQNKIASNQVKALLGQKELINYTTGGENNKPIFDIDISESKDNDGTYVAYFNLYNFGEFPISNIIFEIDDIQTNMYNYYAHHEGFSNKKASQAERRDFWDYFQGNLKDRFVTGSSLILPNKYSKLVYIGKIDKESSFASYYVSMIWNNQCYQASYHYIKFAKLKQFVLIGFEVFDSKGKSINLKKYFPNVTSVFWSIYHGYNKTMPGIHPLPFDTQ